MVATVLTVYGIETLIDFKLISLFNVATVLTVYGIETSIQTFLNLQSTTLGCNSTYRLRY